MTISWLGQQLASNIPTLYGLFSKGHLVDQQIISDRNLVFASLGAGFDWNSIIIKYLNYNYMQD